MSVSNITIKISDFTVQPPALIGQNIPPQIQIDGSNAGLVKFDPIDLVSFIDTLKTVSNVLIEHPTLGDITLEDLLPCLVNHELQEFQVFFNRPEMFEMVLQELAIRCSKEPTKSPRDFFDEIVQRVFILFLKEHLDVTSCKNLDIICEYAGLINSQLHRFNNEHSLEKYTLLIRVLNFIYDFSYTSCHKAIDVAEYAVTVQKLELARLLSTSFVDTKDSDDTKDDIENTECSYDVFIVRHSALFRRFLFGYDAAFRILHLLETQSSDILLKEELLKDVFLEVYYYGYTDKLPMIHHALAIHALYNLEVYVRLGFNIVTIFEALEIVYKILLHFYSYHNIHGFCDDKESRDLYEIFFSALGVEEKDV